MNERKMKTENVLLHIRLELSKVNLFSMKEFAEQYSISFLKIEILFIHAIR